MNIIKTLKSIASDTIKSYGWPVSIICFVLTPFILAWLGFFLFVDWVYPPLESIVTRLKKGNKQ